MWRWWLLLFLNTSAGILDYFAEAPMFQDLAKVRRLWLPGMVGVVSIECTGTRLLGVASDALGRRNDLCLMFILRSPCSWFLPTLHGVASVTVVAFIILIVTAAGSARCLRRGGITSVDERRFDYGLMLTALGICQRLRPAADRADAAVQWRLASGLHAIAAVMAVSVLLPCW